MSAVLAGLIVTGILVLAFAVLVLCAWAGMMVEQKITGDPFSGALGSIGGLLLWIAVMVGVVTTLTQAGVLT